MAIVAEQRDGSEVSVESGIGWVVKVEKPNKASRNAHVCIKAEHLEFEVKAWCDTSDLKLYNACLAAAAEGRRIGYRIVVKRGRGQPADVPLEQIPKPKRIRDLEALEVIVGETPDAAPSTPPEGESAPTAAPTADHPAGATGAPNPGHPADPPQAPVATRDGRRGPRIEEAKPWEPHNTDGTLNLGSYAVQAAEGMVLLAHDLLLARADAAAKAEGKAFAVPTEGQVRALARRLLRAADRAQAGVRSDGHASRMASSHTRCRAAVRAALEAHPVPWGADKDELDVWEKALAAYAGVILRVTVSLVDREKIDE